MTTLTQHNTVDSSASTIVSPPVPSASAHTEFQNDELDGEVEGELMLQRILSGSSGTDDGREGTGEGRSLRRAGSRASLEKGVLADVEERDPNRVDWDGMDDPANPQNWTTGRKWYITALCAFLTVNVTFASSAPSPATEFIAEHFGVSNEVGILTTSLFLCGYVVASVVWGPASELVGRRPVLMLSLSCYTLLHLGQALAPNIQTLLVTRFLGGFFACAPLSNCAGILVDMWDPMRRGIAMSIWTAAVFVGPVCGPIVGGFLATSFLGWRWIFWIMMIFAGVSTLILILTLPETFAPALLVKKAQRLRKLDPIGNKDLYAEHERHEQSLSALAHRTVYKPLHMFFVEPILQLITLYLSLVYGILYALFEAFPIIFAGNHGFTLGESGLIFIGVGIGTTIGSLMTPRLSAHYPELIKKWRGFPPPEERLWGAMIGAPVLVIGCFWLGWTGNYRSVSWVAPAISTIPIGTGVALIFISFSSYMTDTYLRNSASALSANALLRSAVGAAFPLFTNQMFNTLGINWACTLIGFCALLLAPSPFLFYKYGTWIRSKSKFSANMDLKLAQEWAEEEAMQKRGSEKV